MEIARDVAGSVKIVEVEVPSQELYIILDHNLGSTWVTGLTCR